MIYLASNIKLLRVRKKRTQADIAETLSISRPAYSGYENQVATPPLEVIVRMADYFKVSLDTLVKVDLASMKGYELYKLLSE